MGKEVLLEVKDLKKYFKIGKDKTLKAVDGVSFTINKGETLGLVGESGCGKTTCGRTIMGLYDVTDGEIILDGKNIINLSNKEKRANSRVCQMIFQDPYASLNPRMTVGDIIAEGIDIHKLYTGEERTKKIYELLELVGLNKEHASRFAHEFSGGQRQRIGIARALAVEPKFIVCDEPISALDVSIQAQVVNLLIDLQRRMGLTYLFIAHDLSMVRHISDKVGVMYLGNIVEISGSINVYEHPLHPYTKALMSSIPLPEYRNEKRTDRIVLEGEVSSPINPKPGCRFASRCKYANDICFKEQPKLKEVEKEHFVACHLYD
ncbi:ABC transporter ATP-binding protein [Clostridium perfringens]|uniref:ABC transporter ATP-binding protein n=2 Tax=Clostridium perfringens TaxID=1502 RepID=UPI000166B915|nr:oligopeptide/dipeptide ABC transporter ATP-binding protein [Clostridium perfringens]AXH52036.1 ABC transporter ATP-binding protein [Clostridium perfringens]EDS79067.1 oligopeptide transport ATP-binding protein AppF [Clostridium perfringens C str. JGS1495]ELC8422955.1 ATP-binding cassette domain-containing protein [Clostridium perfringens]MBI6030901.1 ATP-binding cassette domain-containing protein [Clostridium perfringens]MBI6034250.1 ATP-binding cassette domain-containing protein [Clostridi